MSPSTYLVTVISLWLYIASPALAEGWEIGQPASDHGLQLTYKGDSHASYLFECTQSDIILTEYGVTDLLDIRTNTKVGDVPGSTMSPGAALMALATAESGAPNLAPAEAHPNALKGWDMTIHLAKNDKVIRAMAKSDMVSVFTTGYTMAVGLDSADKQVVKEFVSQCRAKS